MGSFWEAPLKLDENRFACDRHMNALHLTAMIMLRALLEREKSDLLQELMSLPQNAVVRRINELVKRARSVKVHAYIIHYLRKQMPYVLGKAEKQRQLIDRLDKYVFTCLQLQLHFYFSFYLHVCTYVRLLTKLMMRAYVKIFCSHK